ncbi:MAG: hypothetical protein ACM3N4_11940, partial [Nitrososphaerota archaeon]
GWEEPRPARDRWPARDVDLGPLSELFFVSGVVALLLTRFYLALSGFPQLGGAGLHIAHLLWGGLLMLVALVLLLAFVGRSMQRTAALLGGAGFGLFIDEVGKFVTSSNDYFFQPAVAIIYVVFVAIFLGFRTIERGGRFTSRELVANAYDEAVEVVLHPTGAAHRVRALHLLRASGAAGPLARGLRQTLVEQGMRVPPRPAARGSWWRRATWAMRRAFVRAVTSPWFPTALVLLIVAYAVVFFLLFGLALVAATAATASPVFVLDLFALRGHRLVQAGLLASSLAAGGLLVVGLVALPRNRLWAYQWFKGSTLVWIFFGQIFLFYTQQFGALVELVLSLVALACLDALLAVERRARRRAAFRRFRHAGE